MEGRLQPVKLGDVRQLPVVVVRMKRSEGRDAPDACRDSRVTCSAFSSPGLNRSRAAVTIRTIAIVPTTPPAVIADYFKNAFIPGSPFLLYADARVRSVC